MEKIFYYLVIGLVIIGAYLAVAILGEEEIY